MDCREAQQQLDVIRRDGPELDDPAVQSAKLHVSECEECAAEVESRRALDREIAQGIQAVEVPAGLKSRLLSAVQEPVVKKGVRVSPRPFRRRTWLFGAGLVSLSLLAGVIVYWPSEPELLAVDDVQQWWQARVVEHQGLALNGLPAFDNSFDATVSDGRWTGVLDLNAAKGVDLNEDGRHDLVIYPLLPGKSGGVRGIVMLTAPNGVTNPPAATSPTSAGKSYNPLPHVAWTTSDDRLSICVITSESRRDPLQLLLDAVYSRFG